MKRFLFCALICGLKTGSGQNPVSPLPLTNITALPSMFGGGASYSQLGTPRYNFWLAGIVPISSSVGMYESTTTDLIPIAQTDAATGRTVHTLQATLREGIHKTIPMPQPSKNMLLIGGTAGLAFSQASVTGASVNVNLAASFELTYVRQLNAHWAVIMPIRGLWVPTIGKTGGWNFMPELGVVWKPGN